MKKYFKRLISLALAAVMVMGMSVTAFAAEAQGNNVESATALAAEAQSNNVDTILLERGYPQIVLDTMSEGSKNDTYMENTTFAGAVITYYNESDGTSTQISVNEDGTYVAPRGQIPQADLTLTLACSKSESAAGKLNFLIIKYDYNWKKLPLWRWQDTMSVSWDPSKFEMSDDGFYKEDRYDGYIIGANGEHIGPYVNQIHSSESRYASGSSAGVSWYADLKGYIGVVPTALYGYGRFKLVPKSTTYDGSTIFYGQYVHSKGNKVIGVNISTYGSFSITAGDDYDECGSQKTVAW